jgi:putative pyruvate formate lyase activating enzyme
MRNTYYKNCALCPRNCHVDRLSGEKGYCGAGGRLILARAALHMWEEPCISGEEGSGTVFFSGCGLKCVYCQNHQISNIIRGKEITYERLSEIFLEQKQKGANNINLVTPTHFVPDIVLAISDAKDKGLDIPIVYNTSGYEKTDTLKLLEGLVDVYLPDFKYLDPDLGKRFSNAGDYGEVAKSALAEMFRQVGRPAFDGRGVMKRGVLVRHLLLPGCGRDSVNVVKYLYETYHDDIYISIMNQYTPLEHISAYPDIYRKVTEEEYRRVVDFAIEAGVVNGFIQEGDTAEESFIPSFNLEGV